MTIFPDETTGIASDNKTWTSFLQSAIAPEIYGFEKLDSLSYYTNRLVELNKKVSDHGPILVRTLYQQEVFLTTMASSM